jgi:UDP-2,4-diacetamido-2,4,6-trideoxy-beta-L-altropyranose hydrolase
VSSTTYHVGHRCPGISSDDERETGHAKDWRLGSLRACVMDTTTVVLRADASADIGRGHVARCHAVAVALRQRGIRLVLLSFGLADRLREEFLEIGCSVIDLLAAADASEVARALDDGAVAGPSTAMLVDHYGLDAAWESEVRTVVGRLATLEDRPHRRHDVDLLIDAGGGVDRPVRYAELVPSDAQIVTGHDHAIIDPIYGRLHRRLPVLEGGIRRVLVQLGSDLSDLAVRVLRALATLELPPLDVDVVLPVDHPALPVVRGLVDRHGWQVHCDVAGIWALYASVDLAVGAPGVSVWERCALGVPSVVIETTAMHAAAYEDLGFSPAVTRLGPATDLDDASLRDALDRELRREDLRARSLACRRLIDGRGAHRVASLLTVGPSSRLQLRDAKPDDEQRLLRWANDRHTHAWSLQGEPIQPAEHHRRLVAQLRSIADRQLYVLEDGWGTEVGLARFERQQGLWVMSATLAPGYRARGLANAIVDLPRRRLVEDVGTPCTIEATVRTVRPGAGSVLARLGFEVVNHDDDQETTTYRWTTR